MRPLVTRDPAILGGAPVVAGTRVYAATVASWLALGNALDDVRHAYPTIPTAWIDTLATFPPVPEVAGTDVALAWMDAGILVRADYFTPAEIPALCAALTAAAEASRQWQAAVDAWIAAHMVEDE